MSEIRCTFIDIFENSSFDPQVKKIVIPMIQRDYAQGRRDSNTKRIRDRFLDSLKSAIVNDSQTINLDFVYGDINAKGDMTPLDGQQRLTTLFLLHWYATRKAEVSDCDCDFLTKFSYVTRYSARDFCEELTRNYHPSLNELDKFSSELSDKEVLSKDIKDQSWFPISWEKDPTISSMLVMLDAIHDKFKAVSNLWSRLRDGAITFDFLAVKDMGQTDDLYLKMNSRGKPLTRFEHFKAELEQCISKIDEVKSKYIIRKIDRDWTDLLWKYHKQANFNKEINENPNEENIITDELFLNYFQFICDMICYTKRGETTKEKSRDELDMIRECFGDEAVALDNLRTLEEYFDCWCDITIERRSYQNPGEFLESFIAHEPQDGKIVVESTDEIDIFKDCLDQYVDKNSNARERKFSLRRIVFLYAVTYYLRNRNSIKYEDFVRRMRCINNLVRYSSNEIRDTDKENYMPRILTQVDDIIGQGELDEEKNFLNKNQFTEELEKERFLNVNPEQAPAVFALEDNKWLRGQISIVALDWLKVRTCNTGLDLTDYAGRFESLMNCNLDKIDCALISIGHKINSPKNYSQEEIDSRYSYSRYQYASTDANTWENLFHQTEKRKGFENTSKILISLLSQSKTFDDNFLEGIIKDFISDCESKLLSYPWEYYYVKYADFRPGRYGKYINYEPQKEPYMFIVLSSKVEKSKNAYIPYLKAADQSHLSGPDCKDRLDLGDSYVSCENNAYVLKDSSTDNEIDRKPINHNEDGIDTEDRIILLKKWLDELKNKQKEDHESLSD